MKGGRQRSGFGHTTLPAAFSDPAPGISWEALVFQSLDLRCFRFRLLLWLLCCTVGLRQFLVWPFAISQSHQSDCVGLQTRLASTAVLEWSPGAFWNLKRWLLYYRRFWVLLLFLAWSFLSGSGGRLTSSGSWQNLVH